MKYYKGSEEYNDKPYNGGSYVANHTHVGEEYNFKPINFNGKKTCLGFVETKSTNGSYANDLHIEKIRGCENMKKDEYVDDVLVIWCATADTNECVIVGWYKNATVYRQVQYDEQNDRYYNVKTDADNCVLLSSSGIRRRLQWKAPVAKRQKTYGFGQSLIWYPVQKEAENYIKNLLDSINDFSGENWVNISPQI